MKKFIIRIIIFALALMTVSYLMPSIEIQSFKVAIFAAIILAILNGVLTPILQILSFPITILTLGLFSLVVNGAVFSLASKLVDGFYVANFGAAIIGAILVSLVNGVLKNIMDQKSF